MLDRQHRLEQASTDARSMIKSLGVEFYRVPGEKLLRCGLLIGRRLTQYRVSSDGALV